MIVNWADPDKLNPDYWATTAIHTTGQILIRTPLDPDFWVDPGMQRAFLFIREQFDPDFWVDPGT